MLKRLPEIPVPGTRGPGGSESRGIRGEASELFRLRRGERLAPPTDRSREAQTHKTMPCPITNGTKSTLVVVRSSIEKFCEDNLSREYVRWMDENCDFPPDDLWKKLAEHGIFDRSLASSPYEYLVIQEEIATASVAVMLAIGASIGFGQGFIAMLGTPEQREEFLPKLAAGEVKMCMALTEPGGGTDILGSLRTTAVEDGDHYVLNGQKVFITAAHVADYLIVIAITDPKAEDKSQLVVGVPGGCQDPRDHHPQDPQARDPRLRLQRDLPGERSRPEGEPRRAQERGLSIPGGRWEAVGSSSKKPSAAPPRAIPE